MFEKNLPTLKLIKSYQRKVNDNISVHCRYKSKRLTNLVDNKDDDGENVKIL